MHFEIRKQYIEEGKGRHGYYWLTARLETVIARKNHSKKEEVTTPAVSLALCEEGQSVVSRMKFPTLFPDNDPMHPMAHF